MTGSAFDRLLPEGAVAIESADPDGWHGGLFPEESAQIESACEKRRREFTAGRHCARAALTRLGLPAVAIPVGSERQPLFPPTVSGSITHTRDYCAVALIRKGAVCSLGIDAEDDWPMEEPVARRVMGGEERCALQDQAGLGNVDVLAFGLKEAFYKAAFPLCRRYIKFNEVAIRISNEGCQLELLSPALRLELAHLDIVGRFRFADRRVYSAVALVRHEP